MVCRGNPAGDSGRFYQRRHPRQRIPPLYRLPHSAGAGRHLGQGTAERSGTRDRPRSPDDGLYQYLWSHPGRHPRPALGPVRGILRRKPLSGGRTGDSVYPGPAGKCPFHGQALPGLLQQQGRARSRGPLRPADVAPRTGIRPCLCMATRGKRGRPHGRNGIV